MSWTRVDPVGKAARKERVAIALRKSNGLVYMEVSIGMQIIKLMGWEKGQRVALLWGENRDFGWLRLETQPDGFKLRDTQKSCDSACVLSTTQIHRSAKMEPHSSATCRWRVRESGLEIQPPMWFWGAQANPGPEYRREKEAAKPNGQMAV